MDFMCYDLLVSVWPAERRDDLCFCHAMMELRHFSPVTQLNNDSPRQIICSRFVWGDDGAWLL